MTTLSSSPSSTSPADLVIIGAGAAGMAAAIFAGEAAAGRPVRIILIDGAAKPGAKILLSGGGRCNVTHDRVTPDDYFGGPRPLIRNVLAAFNERATVDWMRRLGVELTVEPTGKLFPVTDNAKTVLDALQRRIAELGITTRYGSRVTKIECPQPKHSALSTQDSALSTQDFVVHLLSGERLAARRLIVACGGRSLPKSGSDGVGLELLRELGHTIVPTTPALVPLVLKPNRQPGGRFEELTGLTLDVRLGLYDSAGRRKFELVGSMLFTHFGVSGPAPMNLSRHWLRARLESPAETWTVCMGHPRFNNPEEADAWLRAAAARSPRRPVAHLFTELFPERLARILATGTDRLIDMDRGERLELARALTRLPLPVESDRGWAYAETTAGGVSLREIDVRTMESRLVPGLHICGEMLDVDGIIGGYSFQWAWSTGHLAGRAAVKA
ncbi:aminoacetone oxidase family FAD-binding enzyme [bacterium]|nr:aminoacetone oxidase family FAD-binding enzyme [bacterium]